MHIVKADEEEVLHPIVHKFQNALDHGQPVKNFRLTNIPEDFDEDFLYKCMVYTFVKDDGQDTRIFNWNDLVFRKVQENCCNVVYQYLVSKKPQYPVLSYMARSCAIGHEENTSVVLLQKIMNSMTDLHYRIDSDNKTMVSCFLDWYGIELSKEVAALRVDSLIQRSSECYRTSMFHKER